MVEPRGTGLVLITLRAAAEIRPVEFDTPQVEIDPVAIARSRSR